MSDCKHRYITTYVDENGEPGGLWGCRDCKARFAPIADQIAVEKQRDELLVALEATVEAIRLFRNEPQLERLVSLRATAGYVAMDAAMDRGTDAIDAARGVK